MLKTTEAGFADYEELVGQLRSGNDAATAFALSNLAWSRLIADMAVNIADRFPDGREIVRAALRNIAPDPQAAATYAIDPADLQAMKRALAEAPAQYTAAALGISMPQLHERTLPPEEWMEPTFQGYQRTMMDLVEPLVRAHGDAGWEVVDAVVYEVGRERGRGLLQRFQPTPGKVGSYTRLSSIGGLLFSAGRRVIGEGEVIENTGSRVVSRAHSCGFAEQFSRVEKAGRDPRGGMCMRCFDQVDQAVYDMAGAKWKRYAVTTRIAAGDPYCTFEFELETPADAPNATREKR